MNLYDLIPILKDEYCSILHNGTLSEILVKDIKECFKNQIIVSMETISEPYGGGDTELLITID